jgi:hypothetical protein
LGYHIRKKLCNFKYNEDRSLSDAAAIKTKINGLHALFSNQTIMEDVMETVEEGEKDVVKLVGRRYLSIIHSTRAQENKAVESNLPNIEENRTDIFTIQRLK